MQAEEYERQSSCWERRKSRDGKLKKKQKKGIAVTAVDKAETELKIRRETFMPMPDSLS